MKEYNKPLIDVVRERAEGVYATSGTNTVGSTLKTRCESPDRDGNYLAPSYNWPTTVRERYGCLGCPANRNNTYCEFSVNSTMDSADPLMPDWEELWLKGDAKYNPDQVIDDNNPAPY